MTSPQDPEGTGDPAAFDAPREASPEERAGLLDILIRIELATQEAYQLGFRPEEEALDQIEARAVEAAGGRRELDDALASSGATMAQFRTSLARNEAMRTWRDTVILSRAKVTEEEARAFYDANLEDFTHGDDARALQIMFPLPVLENPQTEDAKRRIRRRAAEALSQAKAGRDFEALMGRYMDPTTLAAVDGGRMGWVGRTGSFPELEDLILSLKPGEVGGPLETPFSIHIVKVLETREAGTVPYAQVRPDILALLAESRIGYRVQRRSAELLNAADVTVHDPELAEAGASYRAAQAALDAVRAPSDETGSPPAAGDAPDPEAATPDAASDAEAGADATP
jgi:parvulin-like peptidyl-prolyl isomerase